MSMHKTGRGAARAVACVVSRDGSAREIVGVVWAGLAFVAEGEHKVVHLLGARVGAFVFEPIPIGL